MGIVSDGFKVQRLEQFKSFLKTRIEVIDAGFRQSNNLNRLLPDICEGNRLPDELVFLNGVDCLAEGIERNQAPGNAFFPILNQVFPAVRFEGKDTDVAPPFRLLK
jgi:hypothetical protein